MGIGKCIIRRLEGWKTGRLGKWRMVNGGWWMENGEWKTGRLVGGEMIDVIEN